MERETTIMATIFIACLSGIVLIVKIISKNNIKKTFPHEEIYGKRVDEIKKRVDEISKSNQEKAYTLKQKQAIKMVREYLSQTNDVFSFDINTINNFSTDVILRLTKSVFSYVSKLKKSIDGGFTMDMCFDLSFDEGMMLKFEITQMMYKNLYDVFNKRFVSSLFIVMSDDFDLQNDKDLVYFLYETSIEVLSKYDNNPS